MNKEMADVYLILGIQLLTHHISSEELNTCNNFVIDCKIGVKY